MKLIVCLILVGVIAADTLAQSDSTALVCRFGQLLRQRHEQSATLIQRMNVAESLLQRKIADVRGARVQETVYTVPIVVHVIHTGEAIGTIYNPSDASIMAMIGQLNAAFRKNGAQYGGVDIGIQFQLAIRSPSCGSTTGINRVNGSGVPNYTTGGIAVGTYAGSADEVAVKSLSRWPNTDYVNIWIVNKIQGDANAGGFAFFPEYNSALTDGIVITAGTVMGSNKTIVHEMGHVFNLYHTFYDDGYETACPSLSNCSTTGDRVCDTEPVINSPCSATINTCTGAAFQVADAGLGYTIKNNYMGYTNCQWVFTQGQKDRMKAALVTFRNGLLTSGGLLMPEASASIACSVSALNGLSSYYGIERVTFNTLDVYSNSSAADGAFYVDRTCNQRTTVTSGQSYSLTVQASYGNYQYLRAYLDYNADGDFNDAGENIMTTQGGFGSATITIPAAGVTINTPIRLRIVADNPNGASPTACSLNGTSSEGIGQIEDYTVIITPRIVTSVASGSWTNPGTWSCSCIPASSDSVSIQTGHIISISSGLVQARRLTLDGKLQYAAGGRLQLTGN